jgi:hypothetical protein
MTILFENRITDAGRQAIQALTNHIERDLDQVKQIHGENSREAAQCLLALASINQIMEPREEGHASIERYLALSKQIYGSQSIEVANGFLLSAWSSAGLGRDEEAKLAFNKAIAVPGGQRDFPPVEPLLEALCRFLDKLRDNPDSENRRHAFVLGVHTLSWLVTYCPIQSPSFPIFLERLRPVFESRGFKGDAWEWLMRRCNRVNNHFVGLISLLLEEKLVLVGPKRSSDSQQSDSDDDTFMRGYAISGFKQEHWTSPEGFSRAFPVIVAEGDLSLRVERLLAQGCRCLRTTGELGTVFLIFSGHEVGRLITAFGTTTWSDEEKKLFENEVRAKIKGLGADSAMMLSWVEMPHEQSPESDDEDPEAVMVVARDAKSYLRGLQPARKVDGEYVFDEPMVRVAENNWFSEFTFPVQPTSKET